MHKLLLSIIFSISFVTLSAQKPIKPDASEIYQSIKKLNFLGSVLYIAAHPDDENTQLISYFSNDVKARTGYLSITRGDGGQNLIGTELQELLGVIRTQELLAARRTDGGEQFFTRAIDFGYSKHPDETLDIWNKDELLKDVVAIIRKFKPDVIINRFDHRTPGSTHGQHTSSAILSMEAFDLVNDTNYKSHNLSEPWQPKRIFFNTSWWFYGSEENFEKADKSKMLSFNVGPYYPTLGKSNNEIASLSRSQHRSQGFGSTGSRGSRMEYVELINGSMPADKNNIFEGIDTSWNRIKGGKAIGEIMLKVEKDFNFKDPSASIPDLMKAYQLITNLKDEYWKNLKLRQIENIITSCSGLYLEVVAEQAISSPNSNLKLNIEAINRSNQNIKLKSLTVKPSGANIQKDLILENNINNEFSLDYFINENTKFTSPYWLNKVWTLGMYDVEDKNNIGRPETSRGAKVFFNLSINGMDISIDKEIVYKYNDPVKGEVYQPFEILPEVTAYIADKVNIFSDNNSKEIPVIVRSLKDSLKGSVSLCYPTDWKVSPESIDFAIDQKGAERTFIFTLTPPKDQSEGKISPLVVINGNSFTKELVEIDYDHIPKQSVLLESEVKVVRLNIEKKGNTIGYIHGAGDNIPNSLKQIGYNIVELNVNDISADNLHEFDAIILGIRTYNVDDRAKFYQQELHNYVKAGGTLIVQYNTSRGVKVDQVAPYLLKLSRDRVVEEDAKVTILDPEHEMMNYPNKITEKDFDGWIQERGLYFPDEWSNEFTPLLAMHDKDEEPKKGSLLVANYGKGHFIYTGLSFFRELPEGVPGAYRLFANMISVGKNVDQVLLKN